MHAAQFSKTVRLRDGTRLSQTPGLRTGAPEGDGNIALLGVGLSSPSRVKSREPALADLQNPTREAVGGNVERLPSAARRRV